MAKQLNACEEVLEMKDVPMERLKEVLGLVMDHLGIKLIAYDNYRYHDKQYSITTEEVIPYADG